MSPRRIYLSPPDVTKTERDLLMDAFDSNWISPAGPDLTAFESELGERCDRAHVAALASGTAALHLALQLVGVGPGDDVLVPSFTFVATANAVCYLQARPCFVDSEPGSWNIDPDLVAADLDRRAAEGRLPAAVVPVDLYGQCADYDRLVPVCAEHGVPLVADAAEALGAIWAGRPAGSFGLLAALSFNGNKILTTGGGGALVGDDEALVDRARHLATQAREPAPHYEHAETGYNYRLSNLLAAVGRGQLRRLDEMMHGRAQIHGAYRAALADRAGIGFQPVPGPSGPNRWLTVVTVDPAEAGTDRERLRLALEAADIEARPAWKPMHLQPVFAGAPMIGGAVCEAVFADGLCLPSGSSMSDDDLARVLEVLTSALP